MNIITPDEARQILVLTEGKPERLAFVGLAETVLALWPFVEAWSRHRCGYDGNDPFGNDPGTCNCWPCRARRLLQKEKP